MITGESSEFVYCVDLTSSPKLEKRTPQRPGVMTVDRDYGLYFLSLIVCQVSGIRILSLRSPQVLNIPRRCLCVKTSNLIFVIDPSEDLSPSYVQI